MGFISVPAFFVLVVGIVALVRGHLSWARIANRKTAGTVTAVAGVVFVVAVALDPGPTSRPPVASPAPTAATTAAVTSPPATSSKAVVVLTTTVAPPTTTTLQVTTGFAPAPLTSTGPPPATSSHAQTAGEACHALGWLRPAPDLRGKTLLETSGNDLFCFTINDALAPDGHNVADDPMNQAGNWTVVAQEPAPGTLVGETTPIVLHVVPKIRS